MTVDIPEVIGGLVLAGLASVGLWQLITALFNRRFAARDGELERARSDRDKAASDHKDCVERVQALENVAADLRLRLDTVEAHHASLFPRWIVDTGKRICWVNGKAMTYIFGPLGYTQEGVVGRRLHDLLDAGPAREIDRLDRDALARPGEAACTVIQLHGSLPLMVVAKVAGTGRDQELIYEGIAFRPGNPVDLAGRSERRREEQLGASLLRLSASDATDASE